MSSGDEHMSTGRGRPAALLTVRIAPADVGRRVTIRHRTTDSLLTDVVGVLLSWADGVLRVQRRTGEVREVAEAGVVAAKVVAPELSAEAMQRVAQAGWPPFETDSLGEWELRASGGLTGRANSVRVAGDPGVPLDQALAQVSAWYAERGLSPMLQLPEPSLWDAALEHRGWARARRTTLCTVATADLLAACGPLPGGVQAELSVEATEEVLRFVEPSLDPVQLARILYAPTERVFVTMRDADGGLLAAGRASEAASAAGRWAGITSVVVAGHARCRGLGAAVTGELARWASAQGAPSIYQQVLAANAPATALCDRLGFALHHAYCYRSPVAVSPR